MATSPPQTGQCSCYDVTGHQIPCEETGQDAAFSLGVPWPEPRFVVENKCVLDQLTGLYWTQDANLGEFPMTWPEALDFIRDMNHQERLGYQDWRLPNRRELRSLMSYQTRKPALPKDAPFQNVFLSWYWSSTSAAISPSHAWYVHMEGARMFYGGKDQSNLVWPVRGDGNGNLAATGQQQCYDSQGHVISCQGTGQDGELIKGSQWTTPRYASHDDGVLDTFTGLIWHRNTDLTGGRCTWDNALKSVYTLKAKEPDKFWRLPNINELESLIDCSQHSPALPSDYPFTSLYDGYWSSTTSMFEPDWAWSLYLSKGAIGVGYKPGKHFHVWPVR